MDLKQDRGVANPDRVTRRIPVPGLKDDHQVQPLMDRLRSLDGVVEVIASVRQQKLRLTYEANRIGFGEITSALNSQGLALPQHWWMRLKAAWYRFTDENARANATAKGGACCSQPTDVYAKHHKRR